MSNSGINERDPMGHVITGFAVLGEERDCDGRWVGADVAVGIARIGQFFLNMSTLGHHDNELLEEFLQSREDPEGALAAAYIETKPSFVVNDPELTQDVLDRELGNRKVDAGLAGTMWDEQDNNLGEGR